MERNLAARFPELVAQWNWEKNEGLSPAEVTCGSSRKVWWRCGVCGNEWSATVNDRTNGHSCPVCARKSRAEKLSRKNLIPGQTDLATCYPEVASQWCGEKNGGLSPADVSPMSGKKVWWRCDRGHDYRMVISNRTAQGQGCPYCAGKQALAGYNDLQSQFPQLAAQWDTERNEHGPESYMAHSSKKVFWRCNRGHSYLAAISARTGGARHSTGCPYCAGKKVLPGFNDLATVRPELAAQWDAEANDPVTPAQVTEFSLKSFYWVCNRGHRWKATVAGRSSGNGCPVCGNKQLLRGCNDLQTLFPQVAAEWDWEKNSTRPEDHIAGTHQKVWWKCPDCGHRWLTQIKERAYGKTACPRCSFYHKTSLPEQAILLYARRYFPDAVNAYRPEFLAPREIDVFLPSLQLGIEYDGRGWHKDRERDRIKSRILQEHGIRLIRMREEGLPSAPEGDRVLVCPSFSGNLKQLTESLRELFSVIGEVSGMAPVTDIDVERDFAEIKGTYEGTKREKSLLHTGSEILQEWNYVRNGNLTPEKVTPHSHSTVWWVCSRCGREWQQMIDKKMLGGLLCESCSKSDASLRRMQAMARTGQVKTVADYPHLLKEWDYIANAAFDPAHVTYGSERKMAWVCQTCGNPFSMIVKSRTTQGQGCPLCGRKKSARTRSKKK